MGERIDRLLQLAQQVRMVDRELGVIHIPSGEVTLLQFQVLHAIAEGKTSNQDFADRTGASRPATSIRISRLMTEGMIEMGLDEEDRRRHLMRLTDKGWAIHDQAAGVIEPQLQQAFQELQELFQEQA